MREIQLTATAGPDNRLRLDIPADAGEYEVQVTLTPKAAANGHARKPTPEELGWPPGYFETVFGSITDDSFVAPVRRPAEPIAPLDLDP